jgi:hypothetical protein
MGSLSTMAMSMLFRRLDVPSPFGARHRQHVTRSCEPRCWNSDDPFSCRGRHLSAARPATTWSSFAGPGRDPSREFSEVWKPRALGGRRGASALEATIAVRHDDASPHKWGGDRRTWPSLLEKAPKTQKIGLKEQAPALVQRVSDSASSYACGSYRSATQGARGRLCRKPAARPCRPFLCPTPSGEERAANAPSSYNAPDSAAPPDP